jgi:HPr kinase/phosphorylase
MQSERLHATCVALGSSGVLLLGESGMGKSDLALRLIDRGARLIADDQVELTRHGKYITANSPPSIYGLLEIRGLGIFHVKARKKAHLLLVAQLLNREWIERLPYPEPYECLGVTIPKLNISPFEVSAAIKIEMAVAALQNGSMMVGALKE